MPISQRRLAVLFGFAAVVAAVPAALAASTDQPVRAVAECPGGPGISIGLDAAVRQSQ